MPQDTLISRADLIDEFAKLWRSSATPSLVHFASRYQDISIEDLAELVMIDQTARWSRGDRIPLEEYLGQFPQFRSHDEEWVSLVGYEYELRQLHGESPRPEQYYERFPAIESRLREHFRVCHALSGVESAEGSAQRPVAPGVPPKYRLIAVHAEGGLGRVWRAEDRELHREVVVKELRPELANRAEVRARFLREVQVTGQLEHPNIVPVYELIDADSESPPCYAMRFVRGHTLSEAVRMQFDRRQGGEPDAMSQLRLLNAFISVCNAIAYAHSRGIVHRDLKPENIVLGRFGEVFVADWGLAKITGSTDLDQSTIAFGVSDPVKNTVPGSVMGTPAYMAPEQATGNSDLIDARTDIYGLGAILYVILTGKPPHEGSSRSELLDRVVRKDPPRPRSLNRCVPEALEAICLKAMARSPEQRYQSATEVAQDVQCWMVDQPVCAYPEPILVRLRRWTSQHRTIGLVTCLVAVAFGVLSWMARPDQAILEKMRLVGARQESTDRFARFQALAADAHYSALAGPVADLARAERAYHEATGLYGIRSLEDCANVSDVGLDAAVLGQLRHELARLVMLGIYLRDQSQRDALDEGSLFESTMRRMSELGLGAGSLPDYLRAERHRSRDELEDAILCYQRVLSTEPQHYWALSGLGHCYLRTGQAELARLAYQTCIALRPRSPWPWMQRGVAGVLAEDTIQAESDFQYALSLDQDFHPARFNLGLLFASRGEHREAIEQYNEFLKVGSDPDVLNARAQSWMAIGDRAQALGDLESALRLQPGFAPALVSRARIQLQLESGDRAATLQSALLDLEKALESAPSLVEAHLERAKVAELMGDVAGSAHSLGLALEIVGYDASILRERARLLAGNEKTSEAVKDYSILIRSGKATIDDWRRRADCHANLKQWRDAISDYTEVLLRVPDDLEALFRRAQCYAAQHEWAAALADCERVLLARPADPTARILKTRIEQAKSP